MDQLKKKKKKNSISARGRWDVYIGRQRENPIITIIMSVCHTHTQRLIYPLSKSAVIVKLLMPPNPPPMYVLSQSIRNNSTSIRRRRDKTQKKKNLYRNYVHTHLTSALFRVCCQFRFIRARPPDVDDTTRGKGAQNPD